MNSHQVDLGNILDCEKKMVLEASNKYGEYFDNAMAFNQLLQNFIVSIDPSRIFFGIFLQHLRKHYMLSLLSTVRLHFTQAEMDFRQILEA
jgi:hypothetical protein